MNRRTLLTTAMAATVLPATAFAMQTKNYKPGLIQSELQKGRTVFVDFAADWCSTCARQERVINALRQENPAYDKAMTFVRVDWDDFSKHDVVKSRGVPRRSTLLVLKGDKELGRLVAGTSQADIKALMDRGL